MPKKRKQSKTRKKLDGIDRVIDLLERIGTLGLYFNTDLSKMQIAARLAMDNNRMNSVLKKLKKK